jgi:hypothetical protein
MKHYYKPMTEILGSQVVGLYNFNTRLGLIEGSKANLIAMQNFF